MNAQNEDLVKKYKAKLQAEIKDVHENENATAQTSDYQTFKEEMTPAQHTLYEKLSRFAGKILPVAPPQEKITTLQEAIDTTHLSITPKDTIAFALLYPLIFLAIGTTISLFLGQLFFAIIVIIVTLIFIMTAMNIPEYLATTWRMRAGNQMVIAVFYIVTYMRHTSNLELAIKFASDHVAPPLSIDFKKILWDVETGKKSNIISALAEYLIRWKKWNMGFVESLHLIESSLYEASEERRTQLLNKALDVVLDETYERMLHYAHDLKSPITTLHMLGIILPILGLVILPLMTSFMEGVKWYHMAMIYNVILPIGVYSLGKSILSTRPSGYGESAINKNKKEIQEYENITISLGGINLKLSPAYFAIMIFVILASIALIPLILHALYPTFDIEIYKGLKFLDYGKGIKTPEILGPYGIGATLLSLLFPLSIALSLSVYYGIRTKKLIKIREETKNLENEFGASLFQLGNRLADGIPAEIAFEKVATTLEGTTTGTFFAKVAMNIKKMGYGLSDALFNTKTGAVKAYQSNLIESSMRILEQSVKKGPIIASQSILTVSQYIKEIHRVEERLKDLMAEVVADMRSQVYFLAPVISGIVVGITSMISVIMRQLAVQTSNLTKQIGSAPTTTLSAGTFLGDTLPTYFFQIVVGVYLVQIIYILTILSVGIESGADSLTEKNRAGKNLLHGVVIYTVLTLIITIAFNIIALKILASSG